eukprot:gene9838-2161_t
MTISKVLSNKIEKIDELELIIHEISKMDYSFELIKEHISEEKKKKFFFQTVNEIRKFVLEAAILFPKNEKLKFLGTSKTEENQTLKLSKLQIRCLLSCSFFLLLENGNQLHNQKNFPEIVNFEIFYLDSINKSTVSKLDCILHYFEVVSKKELKGYVIFQRKKLFNQVDWKKSTEKLTKLKIISDRKTSMFDFETHTQIDFSNKFIGGGILGGGCYQEEILFTIRPELIASLLFCSVMEDDESILISGSTRFCDYSGYGINFKYKGDYKRETHLDADIVAIDSLPQSNSYIPKNMLRELNKAFCGFSTCSEKHIITGNWGCGAYANDKQVMSLVQILAASQAKRQMIYHTYGDIKFTEELQSIYEFLIERDVTVSQVWKIMHEGFKEELTNFENCKGRMFDKIKNSNFLK